MVRWGLATVVLLVGGCGALPSGVSGDCPGCSPSSANGATGDGNAVSAGPEAASPSPVGGEPTDTSGDDATGGNPAPTDTSTADSSTSDSTTEEPDDEDSSDDPNDSSSWPGDTPIDTGPGQPTPVDPPTLDPVTPPVLDPLVSSAFSDPDFLDDLLSLWADDLVLDLLGSTGSPDDFTYLELLCRDLGLPESYCRRRYGTR